MTAHHFTTPESFIREATRVLKTYGYLVLIDDTVPDDQVEAHAWMNSVERLRDASHVRFVTPSCPRRKWCVGRGPNGDEAGGEDAEAGRLEFLFR